MYENLVERLRRTYTVCGWDDLKIAADAIETIGICWADSKRYAGKLEHENLMLRIELDRLKRERDQAVKDLRQFADGQCLFCKHDEDETFNECGTDNCWQWRGVQEENNATG
jgi:hypothetical protein